ncbi:MAG: hypothetical protein KC444_02820 [Nitrosopumilus sp.]|nr:hypothetical protein [Nitrosopumilus sp.]
MIVIFSNSTDEHALTVAQKLKKNHNEDSLILDLSKITKSYANALYTNDIQPEYWFEFAKNKSLNLNDVKAFWWRRPQPLKLLPQITKSSHQEFALSEWSTALNGIWESTDALWVNDIGNDSRAEHKPNQLKVAQEVGLLIPDTLITNNPSRAIEFSEKHNSDVIFKSFLATEQEWRETRPLRQEFLKAIDSVRFAPVIFQQYVKDSHDLRITIIGDRIFAAETEPSKKYEFDWRMAEISWKQHSLPSDVSNALLKMMRRMGLEYGAIDMKLTARNEYYFLEINTAGQFLFSEIEAHLPISDALAAKLASGVKT